MRNSLFGKWCGIAAAVPVLVLLAAGCRMGEPWSEDNARVIQENGVQGREREVPDLGVRSNLDWDKVYPNQTLPNLELAAGVTARAAWGQGTLYEYVTLAPGAVYPEETLSVEVITTVRDGSVTVRVEDTDHTLARNDVIYLAEGTRRRLEAGDEGAELVEVFSPLRTDHLELAGVQADPGEMPDQGVMPSLEAGRVYNMGQIQLTPLIPADKDLSYPRSRANSRLIWGKNAMLSFITLDPAASFPLHIHPEDQLMIVLRGGLMQTMVNRKLPVDGHARHALFVPGGMVHAGDSGEFGADVLDAFWPVRPDYLEAASRQSARFQEVIAAGSEPERVATGFTFLEGPTWLDGRLYFSDMYFKDPANGDWTGDPKRSRLIRMEPNGETKVLSRGRQTNGTIASRRGYLIVCDMFGHRVVEVHPRSGRVVRNLLRRVDGKAVDGPNDLVMDAKGGIYVTDPQFTLEAKKSQPGAQVYYVPRRGRARVVVPAGEFAMPNGVEISPDGKTFYLNNTWKSPGENFIWAYDIQEDGSLSNKRKFAMLHLTPEVMDAADPGDRVNTQADGMAVDMEGRIYVGTLSGVQIFDKTGLYVGTIAPPELPVVSCTFGGENYDELYMVSPNSVWRIPTRVQGFRHP